MYEVPTLLTTVALNLFMFAVGLKVGPQFFAGLRRDGVKFVAISLVVVGLNFAIAFGASKALGLAPGFATGIISGSMTDTAVIGAATGAVQSGSYQPPDGVTPEDVIGHVAAGYAITYLFALIGIILLVRYLPRLSRIDAKAAAREAEASYGGGEGTLPVAGTDAGNVMTRLGIDARAYRVENPALIGQRLHEMWADSDAQVLQLRRNGTAVDLATNLIVQRGDVVTVVGDVKQMVARATEAIGPEVADAQARQLDLEVADIVVSNKRLVGLTQREVIEQVRRAVFPEAARVGRLVQLVGYMRAGESLPAYPNTRVEYGDVVRVLGPKTRIDQIGAHVGAVVRGTTVSDILTMALGLAIGYVIGYLSFSIGGIPISLGTPAGVMLAGIAISTLRSRNPLFGGPVSEGARSLLQDLGLDLFIAVVALNTAPNVAAAFAGGRGRLVLSNLRRSGNRPPPGVRQWGSLGD
jgi:putative transport protein